MDSWPRFGLVTLSKANHYRTKHDDEGLFGRHDTPDDKLQPEGTQMADDNIRRIPVNELHQEDGAQELASSPDMEPYLNFAVALMQRHDPAPELEAISKLPLEQRYVWRVASALKRGFADFDNLTVEADKLTLTPGDFERVMELLKLRPIQFCIFLKALVGSEEMTRTMVEAIKVAKAQG